MSTQIYEKKDSKVVEGATCSTTMRRRILPHYVQWGYFAAGLTGGMVATAVFHPLELVKIRLQVNEGTGAAKRPQYNGALHGFRSIYRSNGVVGLYQGVVPNVLGTGISWGLFFLFYNAKKALMQGADANQALGPMREFIGSCEAGLLALTLTSPLSVAKTRICLQYNKPAAATAKDIYKGTMDALFKIYSKEGVRGLFKGFIPGVIGVTHGAIQFMIYEEMRKYSNTKYIHGTVDTRLSKFTEYFTFPAISKALAVLVTYPLNVIRTRLQDQHRTYRGVMDVIKQTIKSEGMKGLYKGVCVHLCQSIPNICIVFTVYQCITNRAMHVTAMDE